MPAPDVVALIAAKRDGRSIAADSMRDLVQAYVRHEVPDYQMSAFLMAAFLRGLDDDETLALTDAMLHSGDVLDLSAVPGIKVDKHSTGGVGDKVSLILAPMVAACGVPVPMMSGRGLGHTGGTLDKLESIPGFRTQLTPDEVALHLREVGVAMMGQSERIAPADRLLYALRDVTATVESIPLIASSIMSKKLAEGIDALVLDVKVGRGAFMTELADARALAETLIRIAHRGGKQAVAWLTGMDEPLGRAVGNWPEVVESIACLRGEPCPGLMDVTLALAGEMLVLGGHADTVEAGVRRAHEALTSGRAWETFVRMVEAQGGSVPDVEDPSRRAAEAEEFVVIAPPETQGFVASIDARAIGQAAVHLGAGRARKEDAVDPLAGIVLERLTGDPIHPGEPLARLYTSKEGDFAELELRIQAAFRFAPEKPLNTQWLIERLS
ncbi:MAG TPA: thymidine phosphorylase [Rhodothermales bacterium]